ncbi:glycosyltransferase family 2 protein [Clostridium perfringens]|uniref:glycosyltransferase family 2 protein n=1 Tax=Clostridium perfringens TaxID=1502 RepID=UPI0013E39D63|nr:glycosyltransferase family 2 protein [Clostridium perfringens]MDM0527875.1 glycosyltransferase family 2 protein [Clostridium perfringens]NGT50271.1 glycosyltransferase family 2 protein [Clostridium perfringens]
MKPLVYIILVNYNGVNDTLNCIKSLEKINYDNFKIIIVDNFSNDNSLNILKKNINQKHTIIESEENNGFSAGNNIGIKFAINKGAEYVLLLNNDTIVEKNFLNELVSSVDCNTGIVIGKIYYASEKNKLWYDGGNINFITGKVKHINFNKIDKKMECKDKNITFATGCCMLIPIEVIKKIGLLNEDYFLYYEDSDYCVNVLNNNFNIVYNPNAIIYHSVSSSTGNNSPLSQYYMIRNKLFFIKKNIKPKYKIIAFLWFYVELILGIVKKGVLLEIAIKAIKDYHLGILKKSNRIFNRKLTFKERI